MSSVRSTFVLFCVGWERPVSFVVLPWLRDFARLSCGLFLPFIRPKSTPINLSTNDGNDLSSKTMDVREIKRVVSRMPSQHFWGLGSHSFSHQHRCRGVVFM